MLGQQGWACGVLIDQVLQLGVELRLTLTADARDLALELHAHRVAYRGAERARGAADVVVDGTWRQSQVLMGGDGLEVDMRTGVLASTTGGPDVAHVEDLPVGEKVVDLWVPHDEQVDLVDLLADAPVHPTPVTGPVWVRHGSSISHGSGATAPTATWPAVAARAAGLHLHNLGFGGSAVVDPFMARVIRDIPADVISVKLGINVVNLDAMRLWSFVPAVHGFLDTNREGHPTTPLLLVSPIHCGIREQVPGPSAVDPASLGTGSVAFTATGDLADIAGGRLNLQVVRAAMREVARLRVDDPHLHHLDGLTLYGPEDEDELRCPKGCTRARKATTSSVTASPTPCAT